MPTAYCMRCQRDDLPTGMLCHRVNLLDHGPATNLPARYEGLCLRCCGHNHG